MEAFTQLFEKMLQRDEQLRTQQTVRDEQFREEQRKLVEAILRIHSDTGTSGIASPGTVNIPSMREFGPNDNWEMYLKRLNHHFDAHNLLDDKLKCSYFLSWIGSILYELLQKLFGTSDLSAYGFKELTDKLSAHFKHSTHLIIARHKFWECMKTSTQTYAEWVAELRGVATDCNFVCPKEGCEQSLVDENIRDMLLRHSPNESIRKAALADENPTLEKLLTIATLYESTNAANNALGGKDTTDSQVHTMHPTYKETRFRSKSRNRHNSHVDTPNRLKSCPYCYVNHQRSECRHLKDICKSCKKTGHLSSVCARKSNDFQGFRSLSQNRRGQRPKRRFFESNPSANTVETESVNELNCIEDQKDRFLINVTVNNKKMKFLLDTGATCSIVGLEGYKDIGSPHLRPPSAQLKSYGSTNIPLKGWTTVEVQLGNKKRFLRLLVADTATGANLFGATWFNAFGLKISQDNSDFPPEIVHMIEPMKSEEVKEKDAQVGNLCNQFPNIFSKHMGACNSFKAHLYLRAGATPKFFKPRQVPFAQKEAVKTEIDRLVNDGILKPIQTSEWAAPIVVVSKPNGKVRICGDFKVTINPQMDIEQYPLPRPEELFHQLQNGQNFTKIDLSDAYLQLELDDESKRITVINTPYGLFQYQRLAFGIASAPAIFQRFIEQVIAGLDHCANYLDDIIVTGTTDSQHLSTLEQLFRRLEDHGLRCNRSKCEFFKSEVEYLGSVISSTGIRPSDSGINAVKQLPRPKNLSQLQSFLGKVNYYNKYIANFSEIAAPLNQLRKTNVPFNWSTPQEDAFQALKSSIAETAKLVHFNPKLPIILATDASSYGIGAVLSHRFPDGSEKPIAFASKTMTDAEKNYSQIEKEALSIIFGVKKFHQYLYGLTRPFELQTDHKPLLGIFSPDRKLPVISIQRIQRWAIILMSYNFVIKYRSTEKHANADALSRLPHGPDIQFDRSEEACFHLSVAEEDAVLDFPINVEKLKNLTARDTVLARVCGYVQNGWPEKLSHKNDEVRPYFEKRFNLSVKDGVLLWHCDSTRVIVPPMLRKKVLQLLHCGHFGIVRMKQLARRHCFWPGINADIEATAKNCEACSINQSSPRQEYQPWPTPERPWERVHIDFAGPFMKKTWLLVVDAYSKYPYICQMSSITTDNTIKMLSKVFSHEGLPETLVSDNGTQFTSQQFREFCHSHGIEHLTSAPFHPASNGEAERFVRTFKNAMTKICSGGETNSLRALDELLFAYRTTPNPISGKSPAELLHGRQPRTQLSLMMPQEHQDTYTTQKPKFSVNDEVLYKNFSVRGNAWLKGIITNRIGRMMYEIRDEQNKIIRRHQNQMRKSNILNNTKPLENYDDFLLNKSIMIQLNKIAPKLNIIPVMQPQSSSSSTDPPVPNPVTQLRRSTRIKQKIVRFDPCSKT